MTNVIIEISIASIIIDMLLSSRAPCYLRTQTFSQCSSIVQTLKSHIKFANIATSIMIISKMTCMLVVIIRVVVMPNLSKII